MNVAFLPPDWQALLAPMAGLLHGRLAWRLAVLVLGNLFATGRRTVTSWLRAAGVGPGFASFSYFLAALGRQAHWPATCLLRYALARLAPPGPLLFALDDTPTARYGPHVQGAGIHHNPTPGPTDQRFLYGHVWVALAWVVHHPLGGTIGLPLRALLYVRAKDVPHVPRRQRWAFRTKLELAAALAGWAAHTARAAGRAVRFGVDGFYAKRVKTFLATWRPAGGVIRVVIVREEHGWLALFSTGAGMTAAEVLEAAADRFSIEQDFHDLKEVEGVGQQQVRDIWANVGAFHIGARVQTLVELWAWDQPHEATCDRGGSPWDDAGRRPSHADRRKALQRHCLGEEFLHVAAGEALAPEIQQFVGRLIHRAA